MLITLDNIIIINSHVFYYFALTEAIKKLRTVSNANLTAVPQSTASSARPESGRIVFDMNNPNIPSSSGKIYLRIFGYKAGKLIPSPIYVATFYLK